MHVLLIVRGEMHLLDVDLGLDILLNKFHLLKSGLLQTNHRQTLDTLLNRNLDIVSDNSGPLHQSLHLVNYIEQFFVD